MAYIAEQMEERGDPVDWESLYVQAIATDVCTHPNLLSSLSEGLYMYLPTAAYTTSAAWFGVGIRVYPE